MAYHVLFLNSLRSDGYPIRIQKEDIPRFGELQLLTLQLLMNVAKIMVCVSYKSIGRFEREYS